MCRVGPGTPMGNLLREYWIPAFTPDDLQPDGPPMRMRLLGENLIAFQTTSGKVGLVPHACPHRGASLFFGRNEEDGLRCVYHGWKYDVTGACVDMPSEPPESNFKGRVRATAYPCHEVNGAIWASLGPRAEPPAFPHYEWTQVPERYYVMSKTLRECNWAQALEGDMDDAHVPALHSQLQFRAEDQTGSANRYYGRLL